MKLQFAGGARQVTGSNYLLQLNNGRRLLVDCGLDYENRRNPLLLQEFQFPYHPADIDFVLLTHAHVDHCGMLPALVRLGFQGKIICTPPTAELTGLLLNDSLKIQEGEQKKSRGKKGRAQAQNATFYTYKNLKETMEMMVTLEFHRPVEIMPGVLVEFFEAGHLLGAASVLLKVKENGREKSLFFTGDLGKPGSKLLNDSELPPAVDYLITESTYGGRYHQQTGEAEDEMLRWVEEVCVKERGRLVIPAFSVGRTQAICYTFKRLYQQGRFPNVRVFVDSPLAIKSSGLYSRYSEYLNDEAREFQAKEGSLFEFEHLWLVEGKDESEEVENYYDPCVIVSAAGMVEGGRIQQHIRNNIRNHKCTILIAGFCAEGTLGHRLLQGQSSISIKGREFPVFAQVKRTDVFSSHPDHHGLTDYITRAGAGARQIFLVHGELPAMETLKNALQKKNLTNITIPEKGYITVL